MTLLDGGLSPGTVNTILTVPKLMLRETRDGDLIARNPAEGVDYLKAVARERGILWQRKFESYPGSGRPACFNPHARELHTELRGICIR